MDPNKAKEARALVARANAIIKSEWDRDTTDEAAFGCYKAINAVSQILGEEGEKWRIDPQYVISRICESMSPLASHYKRPLAEVARMLAMMAGR